MKILVGLGNPGEQYIKTRHNIGFMFLDFLAEGETWKIDKKFNALILEKKDLTLIKPMTFMNNSGLSVRSFLDYYKLLPKKLKLFTSRDSDLSDILTVVHDDLDIDFGKHKISINSSSAGHKGVQSIINHLKTKNFRRIRLGVKNENKKHVPGASFVLQSFSGQERESLNDVFREISI
jgi:peptidyl-tRNA hydrolase, PTH1 family